MYLDPVNNIGICILTNGEGDAIYICDELYDFALNLNPTSSIIPACIESNAIEELVSADREIVKILDFMGRETTFKENTPLIILYSDGSTERVMEINP